MPVLHSKGPIGSGIGGDLIYIGQTPADVIGTTTFDRMSVASTMVTASPFRITDPTFLVLEQVQVQISYYHGLITGRFSNETWVIEVRPDDGTGLYPDLTRVLWTGSLLLSDIIISLTDPTLSTIPLAGDPPIFLPATGTLFWVTTRTASGNPISTSSNGVLGAHDHMMAIEQIYTVVLGDEGPSPYMLCGTSLATLLPRGNTLADVGGGPISGLSILLQDLGATPAPRGRSYAYVIG
jgi:hypothetical protein